MSSGGNKTRLPASYAEALVVVSQLEKREVELLMRALGAEMRVEHLEKTLKDVAQDSAMWRTRWERAQAQVGRWFKAHGEAVS